jgi:hypothetical protein
MGEKSLVEGLITDSIQLVKNLDQSKSNPSLVVWYFYEDADEWRLLIAGPEFDQLLPKQEALAYQKVSEAISSSDLQSLSISVVKVIRSDDPLPKALSFLVGTPPNGIIQASFKDTTLNGIFIKEMVILRSHKNA